MAAPLATPSTPAPLPLRHRLYARYCDGLSAAAIAREFGLDRQTVTRHLRIIEEQLNREHTTDLNRLRIRALQAQYRIQATALDALAHEEQLEASSLAAIAAAQDAGEPTPPLYRAQRARLLAVAAHAARTAAQMEGLFHKPSPALVREQPWLSDFRYERLGMRPAPDPAPDLPDDAYDPTDPDDLPDDDLPGDDLPGDDPPSGNPPTPPDAAGSSDPPDGDPPAPADPLNPTALAHTTVPTENPVAFCGMLASPPGRSLIARSQPASTLSSRDDPSLAMRRRALTTSAPLEISESPISLLHWV